jgi:hypothetical protein
MIGRFARRWLRQIVCRPSGGDGDCHKKDVYQDELVHFDLLDLANRCHSIRGSVLN